MANPPLTSPVGGAVFLGDSRFPPVSLVDRDEGRPGLLLPRASGSSTTVAQTAKTMYQRFVPSRRMTIRNFLFVTVVAAGANDTIEFGFMDGVTGNRIATSGAVAGKLNAAAGVQVVPITPTLLQPGTIYYSAMALPAPGGTAAQLCGMGMSSAACWDIAGIAKPDAIVAYENGVAAIPATMGALTAPNVTAHPFLYMRET